MPKKVLGKSGAKQAPPEPDRNFAPVAKAFARNRLVSLEKGWGAGNVVLKTNAKIFAMTVKENLVVKLPAARVAALADQRAGRLFDPRGDGRLMKEWLVVVPGKADWVALAKEAYQFISKA